MTAHTQYDCHLSTPALDLGNVKLAFIVRKVQRFLVQRARMGTKRVLTPAAAAVYAQTVSFVQPAQLVQNLIYVEAQTCTVRWEALHLKPQLLDIIPLIHRVRKSPTQQRRDLAKSSVPEATFAPRV